MGFISFPRCNLHKNPTAKYQRHGQKGKPGEAASKHTQAIDLKQAELYDHKHGYIGHSQCSDIDCIREVASHSDVHPKRTIDTPAFLHRKPVERQKPH